MEIIQNKWVRFILPLLIACLSIFGISKVTTSVSFHENSIQALDEKAKTVMTLTAASTTASTAISMIPGDTATPIANKLADLSGYFLLALCAIYLEKYLLTMTGYASFMVLIPLACLLYGIYALKAKDAIRLLARKILIFGIGLFLVVPVSVKVSGIIETTYKDQIEQTIELAQKTTEEIEQQETEENESTSLFGKIKGVVSGTVENVQNVLNRFIEAVAVMIVTSVVIPIVVLLFFVWLIKTILSVDFEFKLSVPKKREK